MKPAVFHPGALEALRSFPDEVRRAFGKAIFELQQGCGLAMPLSRPMPAVGRGVAELRVRDRHGTYRAFYVVRIATAVVVFHAFVKKSRTTAESELALGRRRLKEMSP